MEPLVPPSIRYSVVEALACPPVSGCFKAFRSRRSEGGDCLLIQRQGAWVIASDADDTDLAELRQRADEQYDVGSIMVHPDTYEIQAVSFRHLAGGLRSKHAFTLRRYQILLARLQHHTPAQIAPHLGCSVQTVRNALHAFTPCGLACLTAQSCVPRTVQPVLDAAKRACLHGL